MRKKELINENRFISEELLRQKESCEDLKLQLDKKCEEIKSLNDKIDELSSILASLNQEKTEEIAEAVTEEEGTEASIIDYGAVIIGKVIISAAEYCGRISCDDEERVSLAVADIFDRTETVKAEILDIISTDDSYDKKCQLMEREYHAAVSFFDRTAARV